MRFLLTILVFLLQIFIIYGQHPDYYQFTAKDGLPDTEFYDMIIDRNGFIWLAANKGLYRYDGQEFKNYTNPEKRSLSVFGLLEDDKGTIWCNNLGGQIFFVKNDSLKIFIDINQYTNASRLHEFRMWKNSMFITSDKGLMQVDLKTKKIDFIKSSLAADTLAMSYSPRIVNNQLLYIEDKYNPHLMSFKDCVPEVLNSLEYGFWEIYTTKQYILINKSYRTGLYIWDIKQKKLIKITNVPDNLDLERTVHLFEDTNGFLWLSTTKGAIRFKLENSKMTQVKNYFPDKFVTRVLQDKKGNYWFTTYKDGIFVISNLDVIRYTTQNSRIGINKIRAITKDTSQNLYYTGNDKDLRRFNIKTQTFSKLKDSKTKYNFVAVENLAYEETLNAIISVGPKTSLWTKGYKKILIVGANWRSYSFLHNNKLLFSSTKESGIIDNIFFERDQFEYKNFYKYLKNNTYRSLRKKRAYTNHFNKKNKALYIGYIDGLRYYDESFNEEPILYKNNPLFATDITETKDGIVWVSSFDYGLLGFSKDSIVKHYDEQSILLSNKVSIIEADGNDLWVATQKGLQYIKRNENNDSSSNIITIDKNDGLETTEILDIEIIKDDVFLATMKGLIKLSKKNRYENNSRPDIYIKSIKINGKDTIIKKEYKLSYDKKIEIQYNSTGFLNPNKQKRYQYRLKGLDDQWNEKHTSFVQYSSLPRGTYTFQVKALNEDGLESENIAAINFIITPPHWKSWWFYTLLVIFTLLAVGLFFYSRIKRIQKQNILLKQKREIELDLINSKLVALRAQMNPHFLFNALNSIQEYILTNQKDLASDYLGKFSDLMRIYLDHSRKNQVTIDEEVKALTLYLELEKKQI
ncbi:ligand-binding sensor domain-containing protein [Flavivirga eckloniae]|uniref:Histidine kinase n=1 Tax=Flavivirga eckloniae TaxID=1803846 RepID=A0A2K9PLH9_9FLAO|nr:histidine kinase [Flavivirga eckloniae]AUP77924.1 hypothetical protein C1H87_04030 [Flavivirga eckloniae]